METAHHLRFYQAQYQPSFSIDADQAKVDDYLALGVDALNTPNIDPDFFNEGNLFSSEKVHHNPLKSSKIDPLLGSGATTEDVYNLGSSSTMISGGNFGGVQSALQQMNSIQMPSSSASSYSSPQQQLEISSQIININSPEMMLSSSSSTSSSSPNNKSYLDSSSNGSYLGNIEDDPTFYSQVAEYEQLAFYGSPEGGFISSQHSAPNSRSSSISSGSGCEAATISSGYEYLLSDCLTSEPITTTTSSTSPSTSPSNSSSLTNSRLAPSPAGSHYSSDSASSKTFTNLDAVQHLQQQQILASQQQQQMISIKQEPVDSAIYQPTVIEEFEQQTLGGQQMYSQQPLDSYSTINTAELAYYCTPQQQQQNQQYNSQQLPSTVSSALLLQPQMQQIQPPTTSHQTGRKRNSAAAFSSAASSASSSSSASTSAGAANTTSTSSSSKKPRMTKREKQKMMESDIGKFETENRDLRQSIDLLERQIAFCKRFLSENVAPVIQRQQQNGTSTVGNGQFSNSQMMITVSEM